MIKRTLFLILLLLFPLPLCAADIGQPAPALIGTLLDGKAFDLSALKGKVVAIHFWASWCAPCREEMPALEAIYRQYHGKGLEVLAISADRPRARSDVKEVMHYFSYPAALLSDLQKNEFGTPSSLPITYIIDTSGTVNGILTPDTQPLTENDFGATIKTLLDKPEPAKSMPH